MNDENFEVAKNKVAVLGAENNGQRVSVIKPKFIVYACDAGMGSSAMGASMLKKHLRDKGYDISVKNYAINEIPKDANIVITHEQLTKRAQTIVPNAYHISVRDFLDMSIVDEIENYINNDLIKKENILINQVDDTKEETIKKAGNILVKNGYVDSSYVDSMLLREKDISTYMGKGIAIPHGEESSKNTIKKSGVSIVLYPNGVDFDGNKAYIVVGIAGKENEHLGIISRIAEILDKYDEDGIRQIANSKDNDYILSLFK
jgi:PTS system mannitol-specific IIC component